MDSIDADDAIAAPASVRIDASKHTAHHSHEFGGIMLLLGRVIDAQQILRVLCLAGIFMACGTGADESNSPAALPNGHSVTVVHEPVVANPTLDRSGHKRRGKASFYARKFSGRKMADGTAMQPQSNNAASKTR